MSHHLVSHLQCDHPGCHEQLIVRGGNVYNTRVEATKAGWENRWGTPSDRRGHDLCPEHKTAKEDL